MKVKLTVRTVEAIEPSQRDVICWDADLPGFGLKVTPKGKRSFFLYYRTADHTQRRPLIGHYPAMRPEKARVIAQDWLAQVRAGGDPSAARKAKRDLNGTGTVAELFEVYRLAKSDLRSLPEVDRIFRKDILPAIGKRRAEEVTRSEVSRLVDNLAKRSSATASNARKRLSAFYSWALPRLPDGAVNPVQGSVTASPPAARERVLSDVELKALWNVLETEAEPWRTALRLMILTGQRRGEVFGANWSEIDLGGGLWTIPAARTKNGKDHVVPLAPQAQALLQALPRHGPVFLQGEGAAEFAMLTGREPSEVARTRWQDIDLGVGIWRISKRRAAEGRAVKVRLSDEAQAFLSELSSAGMVFPGLGRTYRRAAVRVRQALHKHLREPVPDWTWHDIRRTVATGLQRLGVRLEVTEAVLNHVSGSRAGIVGVYQRYDYLAEKRIALCAWQNFVLEAHEEIGPV